MSKLLKRVVAKHMPHLVHKLTPANGYDEKKHHTAEDLHKAGVINAAEKQAIDACIGDLASLDDDSRSSNAAKTLKAAASGKISKDSLNDDEFVKAVMGDLGADDDDSSDADNQADSDRNIVA